MRISCWRPISRCPRARSRTSRRATASWSGDTRLHAKRPPIRRALLLTDDLKRPALRLERFEHSLGGERQVAQPLAGEAIKRVRDRPGDEGIADLAQPRRPGVEGE